MRIRVAENSTSIFRDRSFDLCQTWVVSEWKMKRVRIQWHLLKEKTSVYVVIPAKAGIQGLNNIGRQADSGYQLSLV